MLGRKQRISNNDWFEAIANIETIVPKHKLDQLIERTVTDIRQVTNNRNAAFCWSGGKDSLVLQRLCYDAGLNECLMVISDLEYKQFLQWVTDHMPDRLEVIDTHQDLQWLTKHLDMLFPQDSATAAKWFHIIQHRGQSIYYKEHDLDMMLVGRRKADGNYVGKGTNIYTNNLGVTRFSPMADWTHEDILAFIHYYNIDLPPFYNWPNGYYCGTHSWPARQWTGSVENGWREVYTIEPSIVIDAANCIDSAKRFLDKEG